MFVAGRALASAWVQHAESPVRECTPCADPQLDLSKNHGLFTATAHVRHHCDRQ